MPAGRGAVLLLGATGTIGREALQALRARGHRVVCAVRPGRQGTVRPGREGLTEHGEAVSIRETDFSSPGSVARALRGEEFDAVVSCMASRSGAPRDAWAVDHRAPRHVLAAAEGAGIERFVLLSAICVQKPRHRTLREYYEALLRGEIGDERGEHAVLRTSPRPLRPAG